ncbi:MAG: 50S ribosomal protein L30 [Nitrosomonas sp.]|jgi:large subunit ribosomal protein L30|nr:50S ribosomal protein L30 [Nitrosomonas sp.]
MNASNKNTRIKVTLIKSIIGTKKSHRATVKGLGLRKVNSSAELENTPAIQGMLNKINYLIKFEVVDAG